MITIFVKEGFTNTWDSYLKHWQDGPPEFNIRTYEELVGLTELPAGPIIFSDIERLSDLDRRLAAEVIRVVARSRPDIPILNDPASAMRRFELISSLHQLGLNPQRAYRLTDTITPERFPVFLRYENDHTGPTSGLLSDQSELDRAIVRAKIRGHDLRALIIVEYVESDLVEGSFVKYGAFGIGNNVVARQAHRSPDWVVKYIAPPASQAEIEFEYSYVRDNPHERDIRERFAIASIEFGRIDYSMRNRSLVVWEINTNPLIMADSSHRPGPDRRRQDLFVARFQAAFDELVSESVDQTPISLEHMDSEVRVGPGHTPPDVGTRVKQFMRRHKPWFIPFVWLAEVVSIPFEQRILTRWIRANQESGGA